MKCRSCSAEIADKAIVCYRCGTPTALPAPPQRAQASRGRLWPWLLVVAAAASAVVGYLAWIG